MPKKTKYNSAGPDQIHSSPESQKHIVLHSNGPNYPVVGELFSGSEFIRLLTEPEVDACRELLGRPDRETAANEAS